MYPSSALLGESKYETSSTLLVNDLIEKANGFAGVFSEHKYKIVRGLQARKHICGMTGDGVNDAPALKKADIGIAVADSTYAACTASDMVLTEPDLSVIISAILTSHAIFHRIKTIRHGQPSPLPDSWKLSEFFAIGVVPGSYLALMTVVLFYVANETNFFTEYSLLGSVA
ncbi:hypothetical protein Q3G72_018439 [Acer saccharum]|nr:hypothetical protein Q3G72_018439 [Acer saccharum]